MIAKHLLTFIKALTNTNIFKLCSQLHDKKGYNENIENLLLPVLIIVYNDIAKQNINIING